MIQLHNITKSFGTLQVLKGIDLHIGKGEVVSIVGPSGAGKTTLLQIMGTLDTPDSGSVIVDGIDVTRLKDKDIARFRNQHLGFVFQFHQLLPEFTALENVCIPALIAGKNKKQTEMRAKELLDYLNLSDRIHHKPSELSGGEKRRVAIAGIIAIGPEVLVLDEPTAGLDPVGSKIILDLVVDLNKQGKTIILVTHDMNIVMNYADHVVVMNDGKIAFEGTSSKLFSGDVSNYSIEIPSLFKFCQSLKEHNVDIDIDSIRTVDDLINQLKERK